MNTLSLQGIHQKHTRVGAHTISKYISKILETESISREVRNTMIKNISPEEFTTNRERYTEIIWNYLQGLQPLPDIKTGNREDIIIREVGSGSNDRFLNRYEHQNAANPITLEGKNNLAGFTHDRNYSFEQIQLQERNDFINRIIKELGLSEIEYRIANDKDLVISKRLIHGGCAIEDLAESPAIDIIGNDIDSERKMEGLRVKTEQYERRKKEKKRK